MKVQGTVSKTEKEMLIHDDNDEFMKLFDEGLPLGDIVWKLYGEIIEPHPVTGYARLFSRPISALGIPDELLKVNNLLGY